MKELLWLKIMFLEKNQRETRDIIANSVLFRLFTWVLMILFQDVQFSYLQATDEITRLQSVTFFLSC